MRDIEVGAVHGVPAGAGLCPPWTVLAWHVPVRVVEGEVVEPRSRSRAAAGRRRTAGRAGAGNTG